VTRPRAPLLLCAALTLAMSACGRSDRLARGTPVILISIDTLRADHLPAYGYRGVETPHLDALRRDSILFENAYCQVPLTLPSHAVILTGLLPYQNGVRDNMGFRLSASTPTLASILKKAGYATGAAVSSLALRAERGIDQGFDFYDDHFTAESPDERPGLETAAALEKWIDTTGSGPIFAFLHIYEPHTPYTPPEPFRSRYASSPYDGEIAAADAAVGNFLDDLKRRGIYDRALVIFLSDHGEGLGDHGEDEHGVFLYREAIRVPFWWKFPGARDRGRSVSESVGLVDLAPTLAAALRLPADAAWHGIDVLGPTLAGKSGRLIYAETLYPRLALGWSDLACLVDGRRHYIEGPRAELYDIGSDPGERHDVAATEPDAVRSMRAQMAKLPRDREARGHATPEEIAKLGALGYISVSRGSSTQALPDPRDKIGQLRKYKKLFDLYYAGENARVVPAALEILGEDPQIASVWRMLAKSRERMGDLAGAARDLATGLEKCPDAPQEERSQMLEQQAGVLLRAGKRAEAERVLRSALASPWATDSMKTTLARLLTEDGRSAEALALLPAAASDDTAVMDARGVALAEAGRLEEARSTFLAALAKDPSNAAVLLHMGMLSLREKDAAAARSWFEKSLASQPKAPGTLSALGLAQIELRDEAGAFESWSRAVELDPGQYDTLFNLAVLAGRMGKKEAARHSLEQFIRTAPTARYAGRLDEARRLLRSLDQPTG
jgi:choline-sulfatase